MLELDVERLVSPIRDDSPAGDDLRLKSADITLQTINDARTEIPVEDDPGGVGRSADWVLSFRTCEEALASKTKDLEIAAWLTEALTRIDGFSGLHAGLQLATKLARTFWQHIHPGIDEDDGEITLSIRARPLTWMGASKDFLRAVSSCPIVDSADGRMLSWFDYKNSELVDRRARQSDQTAYNELLEIGYISGDDWIACINSTDLGALRQTVANVRDCEAALDELRTECNELFKEDEPNFVGLAELLLDVREYLEARIPAPGEAESEGMSTAEGGEGQQVPAGPGASSGPVASREDALRRLTEVSDYFRRSEPHSPIAYLIQRTIRWGQMPLPELLKEIVKDDNVLSRIWDTLGIQGGAGEVKNNDHDDN
ncbi:MAG: type VI secretion system protein TssA [Myxococcales bacterium]|nr:type VI secretion system protein TssA [Myxococcales bacterium]